MNGPVTAGNDLGVGALGVGHDEHALRFIDSGPSGTGRQGVGSQLCFVRRTNALHPDVVAEVALKATRNVGTSA